MRLVNYLLDGEKKPRVGLARDETPEAPILDLDRSGRRLGVSGLPRRASIKQILNLGDDLVGRLSRRARSLWRELDRSPRQARRILMDPARIQFLPPIPDPEKIICIGQNYLDHCREQNVEPPQRPIIFAKFPPALIGHLEPVRLPRISKKVDFEAELAVVIGTGGRNIRRERANLHVAGYMPMNDVSARDLQFADGQWIRGKSCDTFAPCGPALVTRHEVTNPHRLGIGLELNGKPMQNSSTRNLIFKVPHLISFISQVITLKTGDIISTGTPPGVGCFRKPPIFLKPRDEMTVWIEKLGRLTNPVAAGR